MNELDKVWLACAIDSEGSIFLEKTHSTNLIPRIAVSNTNRPFVEKAVAIIREGFTVEHSSHRGSLCAV